MLSSHAGVELRINSSQLIASAAKIEMVENSLVWQDWRMLQCSSGSQGIGGLLGDLTITGDKMAELLWILQLGTMFNCGRGATYGAGQYRLSYC